VITSFFCVNEPYIFENMPFCYWFSGPLSFKADYVNMANDSIYHVIDRLMAVTNLLLYAVKLAAYFWHARTSIILSQTLAMMITIMCFMNSQKAQIMQNTEGFCFWHSLWHLGVLFSTFVDLIEVFVIEKQESPILHTESLTGSLLSKESQIWLKALMKNGVNENCGQYNKITKDM